MEIKIPWQITKWTSNFLSNRKKEKEDHKASKPFTRDAGASEGSIVGIILFKGFVYKQICKKSTISKMQTMSSSTTLMENKTSRD